MTSPTAPAATGKRHYCTSGNGAMCTHGDGAPKRKKCAYCGGTIATMEGVYGVFEWQGDGGRYRLENAVKTFTTRRAADKYADAHARDNLVSRWLVS